MRNTGTVARQNFYLLTWQVRVSVVPAYTDDMQKKSNSIAYRKRRAIEDSKMMHFVPDAQRPLRKSITNKQERE
jgi:hypothetical protein